MDTAEHIDVVSYLWCVAMRKHLSTAATGCSYWLHWSVVAHSHQKAM